MKTLPDIFNAFGGLKSFAQDTGINHSTVRSMSLRESIDSKHWLKIIKAAEENDIAGVTLELLAKISARKQK